MTNQEAMKLALEALIWADAKGEDWEKVVSQAIRPMQDALAKQEQGEPVAWIYKGEPSFDGNKWHDTFEVTTSKQVALWKDKSAKPLYTTPPQRKPLTDEELKVEFGKLYPNDIGILELSQNNKDFAVEAIGARHHWVAFKAGAKAIEAAHGIKE